MLNAKIIEMKPPAHSRQAHFGRQSASAKGDAAKAGQTVVNLAKTSAVGQSGAQIVCKYLQMNGLRNRQLVGRSNSVKVNQTSCVGPQQSPMGALAEAGLPRRHVRQSGLGDGGSSCQAAPLICQPNRGNILKMPKMPKFVQSRPVVMREGSMNPHNLNHNPNLNLSASLTTPVQPRRSQSQ
jgi:hypothetical protein